MGKSTCLDFTTTNALQAATLEGCAEDVAFAVDRAVATKFCKYMERCEAEGLVYIPLAIETFGGWHPQALQVISCLALQLARATDGKLGS